MHDAYDRSSKWMIQHHGDALLRLGEVGDVRSWRPLQADLVQPRQLPDGLLEVYFAGQSEPDYVLVEISAYPERRLLEQVVRGTMLVYLDRHVLPEMLTLILRPKGNLRIAGTHDLRSGRGSTELALRWRAVELWNLPANELLAAGDVGLIPWVPLAQSDIPPEELLRECHDRIDEQAPEESRINLLAVTQVMTRLRYDDPRLLTLIGGKRVMNESPLIQELVVEKAQKYILLVLRARFGRIERSVGAAVRSIQDEAGLDQLLKWAACCPDIDSFQERLSS